MWRWIIILIGLQPPFCEQHKSISGQYAQKEARVAVQINEALQVMCSVYPP
jgi:hypothetical protein